MPGRWIAMATVTGPDDRRTGHAERELFDLRGAGYATLRRTL